MMSNAVLFNEHTISYDLVRPTQRWLALLRLSPPGVLQKLLCALPYNV